MTAPYVAHLLKQVGIGAGHSTTGALEGGEVGQLLDRFDERVQPLHLSTNADVVTRQAVTQQSRSVERDK